jgi:hypothetical protein
MLSKSSLFVMGSTTASISSWICLSRPPISNRVKDKVRQGYDKGKAGIRLISRLSDVSYGTKIPKLDDKLIPSSQYTIKQ